MENFSGKFLQIHWNEFVSCERKRKFVKTIKTMSHTMMMMFSCGSERYFEYFNRKLMSNTQKWFILLRIIICRFQSLSLFHFAFNLINQKSKNFLLKLFFFFLFAFMKKIAQNPILYITATDRVFHPSSSERKKNFNVIVCLDELVCA